MLFEREQVLNNLWKLKDYQNNKLDKINLTYLAQIYNIYLKPYYQKLHKGEKISNPQLYSLLFNPSRTLGLNAIFDKFVADLKDDKRFYLNKDLFEKIKKTFNESLKLEREIIPILIPLFIYLQHLEIFKNYKSEELSFDKILKLNNKYSEYIVRKLNEELKIISMIKSL